MPTEPDTIHSHGDAANPSASTEAGATAEDSASAFARAAEGKEPGLVVEFVQFLRENKAWWLAPILVALALLGLVGWLMSTAVAPFIYPLF